MCGSPPLASDFSTVLLKGLLASLWTFHSLMTFNILLANYVNQPCHLVTIWKIISFKNKGQISIAIETSNTENISGLLTFSRTAVGSGSAPISSCRSQDKHCLQKAAPHLQTQINRTKQKLKHVKPQLEINSWLQHRTCHMTLYISIVRRQKLRDSGIHRQVHVDSLTCWIDDTNW